MRLLAAPLGLASALLADVRTVGPPGSGADFDQVQPAIAASASGDVILVAAGVYEGFLLDKPLLVQGAGPELTRIQAPEDLVTGLRVAGLDAGEVAIVAGMTVRTAEDPLFGFGTVEVDNCPGTVILHDLSDPTEDSGTSADYGRGYVWNVERCLLSRTSLEGPEFTTSVVFRGSKSRLWLVDSEVGFPELTQVDTGLTFTTMRLTECEVQITGGAVLGPDLSWAPYLGGWAVEMKDSLGYFGGATVIGGDGEPLGAGGEAVTLLDGSFLTAGANCVIEGGADDTGLAQQQPVATSADSTYQPLSLALPTLSAEPALASAGDSLTLTLRGDPGDAGTLVASLRPGAGLVIDGIFGDLFVDPAAPILLGDVTLDALGQAQVSFPMPALSEPTLATFQWIRGGGPPEFSNPAFVSVR